MKLIKVLKNLNSFERNPFLKILGGFVIPGHEKAKMAEDLLSKGGTNIKDADEELVFRIFSLFESEFLDMVKKEFGNVHSQFDIISDILIRDGNCIMSREWLNELYRKEVKNLKGKIKEFNQKLENDDDSDPRLKDYITYKECLKTAYENGSSSGSDKKVTPSEQSILNTLSSQLSLSDEEVKLINYSILSIKELTVDEILDYFTKTGLIFYSRKRHTIYTPDEIIQILRKARGKEVADKHFRRVLRVLKDPQINLIARKHNMDRTLSREGKVKEIINEGLRFSTTLRNDIFKPGTKVSEKKKFLNEFIDKKLNLDKRIKGATIDQKLSSLIEYFNDLEKESGINISIPGYERMLIDLQAQYPVIEGILKNEFELQENDILNPSFLLDFNIKPRDVLDLVPVNDLKKICEALEIKTRGGLVENFLEKYKDSESIYLENYHLFGLRDGDGLKERGINLKDAEIGIKFEDLTKSIFQKLKFNVDEDLRKKLNTQKNKMDVLINLGKNQVILIECKSKKDSGYNKFSSVSRQIKAYRDLVVAEGYSVIKCLLVAPDFSDDFVNESELELDLNLSLIKAESLLNIYKAFQESKHKEFPYKLFLRDVLINEDRVVKALRR